MTPHVHRRRTTLGVILLAGLAPLLIASQQAANAGSGPQLVSSVSSVTPSVDTPVRPAAGPRRALYFGDSYFVGGGCNPDPSHNMAHVSAVELGYRPVVRGAGGTGFVAANPEYGIPPYLQQIRDGALKARNPALVVIEGGSNDLAAAPSQVRKNAVKVLQIARRTHPAARLVLVGPMDPYGGYADTNPIARAVKQAGNRTGVPYINAKKWMQAHPELICDDYIHPTSQGGAYLGHKLAKALTRLGAVS